mgnify:CR=1 FL=1
MTIGSTEHYDIIEGFERQFNGMRLDKEEKELWYKGNVYQSGETNALYKAYIAGYSHARCEYINERGES